MALPEASQDDALSRLCDPRGNHVAGIYRERLTLASGRFAMIDNGLGFQLVPWNDALGKRFGQQIDGIAMSGGGIDWTLGRSRSRGLGL